MLNINQGSINIWIDEIVPCLIDTETNQKIDTVVFKVESRNFLKQFTENNGWYINWYEIPNEIDVYALALKSNNEIEGLIAIRNDINSDAAFIHWACTAPRNNIHEYHKQKYKGVGGHLFAIAAEKSLKWGHGGVIHGFAANEDLVNHYTEKFNAELIGMLHQFQFMIDEINATNIMEVYNYEWN